MAWQSFWFYAGGAVAVVAVLMLVATPANHEPAKGWIWTIFSPFKVVLANPQSWLCGIIGVLLFMPTTIGDMIKAMSRGAHSPTPCASSAQPRQGRKLRRRGAEFGQGLFLDGEMQAEHRFQLEQAPPQGA